MPTGISGFDQLVDGGMPRGRTTLVLGGAGTGKTLFALETLVNGARRWGEPGIFVAFEERPEQVVADAGSFGWDLPALQQRRLFFLDARLPESAVAGGEFDLLGLLASLDAKVRAMGAQRIVFDGVDLLLAALQDPGAERRELARLREWLARRHLSGIVTCKTENQSDVGLSSRSYLPYLADGVVVLDQQPAGAVLVRRLRIAKCRGISHAGGEVPFTITPGGLEVASYPSASSLRRAPTERISSGIPRLDTMLGGGYYRGASVIMSGTPGTAKTTLAACFAAAAAARGDDTLFVTFDESPGEVIRNLRSVDVHLERHVREGRLEIVATRKGDRSAEDHVAWIAAKLRRRRTACLIIDPVSALGAGGGQQVGEEAAMRLVAIAKSLGVTLLMTTLTNETNASIEATATQVSTIADTWIHLSYVIRGGERNRAITVVKSRGSAHSNQVRELMLSSQGVTLSDVYLENGEVLMGTLRRQRELEERSRRLQQSRQLGKSRRDAELALAQTRARIAELEIELAHRQAEMQAAAETSRADAASDASERGEIGRLRLADVSAHSNPHLHRSNGQAVK